LQFGVADSDWSGLVGMLCYTVSHTRTGTVKISVADLDLMGSPGSGSRRAKMTHENRKKLMDLIFLSVVYSCILVYSLEMLDQDSMISYSKNPNPQHWLII
jgi:hypothetical protein